MPYTLIKGTFHIHYPATPRNGPEPDGDTIKFLPDNRELIENLPRPNRPATFNQAGISTIRFEGIDALETHFRIEGENYHQNMALAISARDTMLELAGFGNIRFFADSPFKVESVDNHPRRGYVLSNGLDTYGRTIAFLYIGEDSRVDGSSIYLEPEMLDTSLNAELLSAGHAYPAFYLTLPAELRAHLKSIVSEARASKTGLWASASATTIKRASISSALDLQQLVIWPKLFRRLAAFYQDGNTDLSSLDSWLRADARDRDDRLLLPNQELGNMHDLVKVNGRQLHLSHLPEDIVIVPDDYTLPDMPGTQCNAPNRIGHVGPGPVRIIAALINPKEHNEVGFETVTVLNTSDSDIDISNWQIADNRGQQVLEDILARGDTRRIKLSGKIRLNNTRDTITILDAESRMVDQISYEARILPAEGQTMLF